MFLFYYNNPSGIYKNDFLGPTSAHHKLSLTFAKGFSHLLTFNYDGVSLDNEHALGELLLVDVSLRRQANASNLCICADNSDVFISASLGWLGLRYVTARQTTH